MSLYNGPPRGGTRGGKDQFSWDNVKADKDREYYLGHSVKATTGRWQKGKDVFWYTREKQDNNDAAAAELLAVKQREEDLMAEALGIKPKVIRAPKQPSLDKKELAQLMQKDGEEDKDENREAERIKGLGYSVTAVRGAGEAEHELMPGTVPSQPAQQPSSSGRAEVLPLPPALNPEDAKRMRKAQKKAAKEARRLKKREERKLKKTMKKAKKAAKKAKQEAEQIQQPEAEPQSSSDGSSHSDADSDAPAQNGHQGGDGPVRADTEEANGRHDASPPRAAKRRRHDSPSPDRGYARSRGQGADRDHMQQHKDREQGHVMRPRHDSRSPDRDRRRRHHSTDRPERSGQDRRRHDSRSPERRHRDRNGRDRNGGGHKEGRRRSRSLERRRRSPS